MVSDLFVNGGRVVIPYILRVKWQNLLNFGELYHKHNKKYPTAFAIRMLWFSNISTLSDRQGRTGYTLHRVYSCIPWLRTCRSQEMCNKRSCVTQVPHSLWKEKQNLRKRDFCDFDFIIQALHERSGCTCPESDTRTPPTALFLGGRNLLCYRKKHFKGGLM